MAAHQIPDPGGEAVEPERAEHYPRYTRRALLGGAATLGLALGAGWLIRGRRDEAGASLAGGRVPVIGYIASASREPAGSFSEPRVESFRQGLAKLGYAEGRNIHIEYRFADGDRSRLSAYAAELVALPVDVIVLGDAPSVSAVRPLTTAIPVVMTVNGDPVGFGIVESLSRPGGNITGLATVGRALAAKRIELLTDVAPEIRTVALVSGTALTSLAEREELAEAAALSGLRTHSFAVANADDIDAVFAQLAGETVDALAVVQGQVVNAHMARITELALRHRLPSVGANPEFSSAGGLLSYSPNYQTVYERAADYVDRLLKGGNPAEMPIEQPTAFELVINMKTADALGRTISAQVLDRATTQLW